MSAACAKIYPLTACSMSNHHLLFVATVFGWQSGIIAHRCKAWKETSAAQVIDRLEATMRLKKFNQLGGLQLDRDVRILTSTLADITQQAVRDHFARVSQMATILSLESVSEFLDYWGDSSTISWRFGEAQVREVLQQRTDFMHDEIAALPLYIQ